MIKNKSRNELQTYVRANQSTDVLGDIWLFNPEDDCVYQVCTDMEKFISVDILNTREKCLFHLPI